MIVEIIGGPRDGETLEVLGGMAVAFPAHMILTPDIFPNGVDPDTFLIHLPIHQLSDGRFIVKWPK